MAKCEWDPSKHGGKPCPIHGSGMWDENILTKQDKIEKLKEKGYTEEEIEEELKGESFDDDFEFDEDYERSWGPIIDEEDEAEIDEMIGSEEYAYGGLKSKEELVNALVNRGKIDENTAKAYVKKHWNDYNKYFNSDNEQNDEGNQDISDDEISQKLEDYDFLDAEDENQEDWVKNQVAKELGISVDKVEKVINKERNLGSNNNKPTSNNSQKRVVDNTIHASLKNQLLNGEITLDEAASALNKAGWYNFKPSREETIKTLGLGNDFKDVPLKKRLSREEFDDLVKKDFSTLSEEDKDALIRAIRGTYKLKSKEELPF